MPKSFDYYQVQLTRLLEEEKYVESARLLEFLLQCQGEDEQNYEEWKMLLNWLYSAFPQTQFKKREDDDEDQMLASHLQDKSDADNTYVKRILDSVLTGPFNENKLLALEQLVPIEHPLIDPTLLEWLDTQQLHPLLQFHLLQTLKKRGVNRTITLTRMGKKVDVHLFEVPEKFEQFPNSILEIAKRVMDQTQNHEPTLSYFAHELWKQFTMGIYGSVIFELLLREDEISINIWAAALHMVTMELLNGYSSETQVFAYYDLTNEVRFRFGQAYRQLKSYVLQVES